VATLIGPCPQAKRRLHRTVRVEPIGAVQRAEREKVTVSKPTRPPEAIIPRVDRRGERSWSIGPLSESRTSSADRPAPAACAGFEQDSVAKLDAVGRYAQSDRTRGASGRKSLATGARIQAADKVTARAAAVECPPAIGERLGSVPIGLNDSPVGLGCRQDCRNRSANRGAD